MVIERKNPLMGEPNPYIDDPDTGSIEWELEGDPSYEQPEEALADGSDHSANLAEVWDEKILAALGMDICKAIDDDKSSRKGLEDQILRGLEELGLRIEDETEPFEGACTATHPLLLENLVKYQSKAIQEVFPAAGPVKTRIFGASNPEIEAKAARIKEFMNYQILEEMVEFVDEFERMLFSLGLVGTAIRKVYWDQGLGRPISEFVPLDQFIVSYNAPDLRRAERYTHVIFRNKDEFEADKQARVYCDVEVGSASRPEVNEIEEKTNEIQGISTPGNYEGYTIYEHHCYFMGPDDDFPLPYVVAVHKDSQKVLAVRRNWHPADKKRRRLDWFVRYLFVPSTGFYGFGLLQLIGNLSKTATEVMRSLVDAGQFANLQGGFKLRNLRIVGNQDRGAISPGEWRDVDAPNMDLGKAILPVPYKEPSQTLFQLLQFVVGAGQKFADTTEQVIADSTNYGPVGTTMALLEASTKFFSALHKRLHAAFKNELRILKRINANQMPDTYPYPVEGGEGAIKRQDFLDSIDIIPASDPNTPSQAHRVTRAQTVMQMAMQRPDLHDMREVYRRMYAAMEVEGLDKIMPPPTQPQQLDPLSDIMAASKGQPIMAFPGQDHDAHVQVKSMFLQDPNAGGSPMFQPIVPIIVANIREHTVLKYQEAAQAMGGDQAQAAQQVASMAIQQALQQQQQAMAQDPSIQLGMMELQQRNKEHEDKMVTDVAGLALKSRELDIREGEAMGKGAIEGSKLQQKEVEARRNLGSKLVDVASKLIITEQKVDADVRKAKIAASRAKAKD